MKKVGCLYTCDRCGATEFVADTFTHSGIDHTPETWTETMDKKYLCPACTDLYNQMINNFYAPEVKRPVELDG